MNKNLCKEICIFYKIITNLKYFNRFYSDFNVRVIKSDTAFGGGLRL